jgi:hypothetical protein
MIGRYMVGIIDCSSCCYYRDKHKFSFIMPKTTRSKNVMSDLFNFIIRQEALTKGEMRSWDQLKRVKFSILNYDGRSKLYDTVSVAKIYFILILLCTVRKKSPVNSQRTFFFHRILTRFTWSNTFLKSQSVVYGELMKIESQLEKFDSFVQFIYFSFIFLLNTNIKIHYSIVKKAVP